ncbi:hypothetical protein CROQUDRAFT_661756 [Cronartium quercuum f. sp. fusiforme G11]|uniref:Uncharacterized protein n=1 Tax=Cronartium quercuum f. sp. fusiforme G11 TaxID=708437 RepID=A0A9P6NFJ8_9BASI|nr:hypothetical protein CROQUDRAFT_661756 [Cronartium quercuum f. sp. fusiforme G11]
MKFENVYQTTSSKSKKREAPQEELAYDLNLFNELIDPSDAGEDFKSTVSLPKRARLEQNIEHRSPSSVWDWDDTSSTISNIPLSSSGIGFLESTWDDDNLNSNESEEVIIEGNHPMTIFVAELMATLASDSDDEIREMRTKMTLMGTSIPTTPNPSWYGNWQERQSQISMDSVLFDISTLFNKQVSQILNPIPKIILTHPDGSKQMATNSIPYPRPPPNVLPGPQDPQFLVCPMPRWC